MNGLAEYGRPDSSMANKRRQPVSVTGTEKLMVTSPARRSNRRRAAVESARRGGSPCSENRAEERSLYKTPKRTQVSRSRLPTFSSPTNEIDNQQEIFWDPQSPTVYKLGKSQKKLTVGGHTVEISEIVNRIAPQDEKPACYEGSLLGLWIGEDAIPCTPGVTKARSRIKINTARDHQLKHGEELMKLAKQFDKNLIDAVQEQKFLQPNSIHVSSTEKPSIDHHIRVQREDQRQLLNEHLALNSTLSHGRLKDNAGTAKSPKSSSQKSIDLDAEGALNELFDCSTQKCSGQLSQGMLNCSLIPVVQDKGTLLEAEQPSVSDGQNVMHLKQHSKFLLTEKARTSVQTFSGAELSNNNPDNTFSNDNYDWDADLLPDDSLLMQIIQEPELLKSAEDAMKSTEDARISEEKGESKKWTINSKKPSIIQAGVCNSSNTIPVSCVSMSNQNIQTEKAKIIPFHEDSSLKANKVGSFSKTRQNNTLDYNFTSVKSENRNVPHGPSHLKSATNTNSEKRTSISFSNLAKLSTGKFKSHMRDTSYKAPVVSANKNHHDLNTAANQGNSDCPPQTSVAKKGMFSFDDWGDPKFSDEVLELFCESNTSWGTHCDDDDDLLYQVCDDVERKTQTQMGMKETEAKAMAKSTSNLAQSLCQPGPSQRLPICLQTEKNLAGRKTFSLDLPIAVRKNENSANTCTVFEGSFASGTGTATMSSVQININNRQWQNGHYVGKIKSNCNQLSSEKSKYMFKKTSRSQALILDHKNVNVDSLSGTNKGLWESKNAPNIPFQKVMNGKPVVKNIDFAPSEKEYKSRRCSQEEIARKKQEALERRKCKMETLFRNAAPS